MWYRFAQSAPVAIKSPDGSVMIHIPSGQFPQYEELVQEITKKPVEESATPIPNLNQFINQNQVKSQQPQPTREAVPMDNNSNTIYKPPVEQYIKNQLQTGLKNYIPPKTPDFTQNSQPAVNMPIIRPAFNLKEYRLAFTNKSEIYPDISLDAVHNFMKNRYNYISSDDRIPEYMDSFWVLPDGEIVGLDKHHYQATIDLKNSLKLSPSHQLNRDLDDVESYEVMGNLVGAIRVFYQNNQISVTSYVNPTKQQINSIQRIYQQFSNAILNIDQYVKDEDGSQKFYDNYQNVIAWGSAMEALKPKSEEPNAIQQLNDNLALQSITDPVWKQMDRKRLQEDFPGDENEQFRNMYQKSAFNQIRYVLANNPSEV